MNEFLKAYGLPTLKQDEINNLSRDTTTTKTAVVIKKSPKWKMPQGQMYSEQILPDLQGRSSTRTFQNYL